MTKEHVPCAQQTCVSRRAELRERNKSHSHRVVGGAGAIDRQVG